MSLDINPLISVIVPIYKSENYLHKCVDSILAQTYTNLEIILVNDGSPDNSGKICDEYASKDSRVKTVHKENGGVSSARNAGLDVAAGEYIEFVDSDDTIESDMVEILYNALAESDADMAVCGFKRVYSDFTGVTLVPIKGFIQKKKLCYNYIKDYKSYSRVLSSPWNKLIKSILLQGAQSPNENFPIRFPEDMAAHEDVYFNNCLINNLLNGIVFVDATPYNYMKLVNNDSLSKQDCCADGLKAISQWALIMKNNVAEKSNMIDRVVIAQETLLYAASTHNAIIANKRSERKIKVSHLKILTCRFVSASEKLSVLAIYFPDSIYRFIFKTYHRLSNRS